MIKNVLQDIGGIGIYGIISICLFFLVFTFMLIWTCFLKKPFLNNMSELPLDGENPPQSTTPNRNER